MNKRLISLLLALCMLLTSVLGFAENEASEQEQISVESAESVTDEADDKAEQPSESALSESESTDGESVAEIEAQTETANETETDAADETEDVSEETAAENDDESADESEAQDTESEAEAETESETEASEETTEAEETEEESNEESNEESEAESDEDEAQIDYTKSLKYSVSFTQGYVQIDEGTYLYEGYKADAQEFAYAKKSIVYVVKRLNAGGSNDKLLIAYATNSGEFTAYVSAAKATPLSPEAVDAYLLTLEKEDAQHFYLNNKNIPLGEIEIKLVETEAQSEETNTEEIADETDLEQAEAENTETEASEPAQDDSNDNETTETEPETESETEASDAETVETDADDTETDTDTNIEETQETEDTEDNDDNGEAEAYADDTETDTDTNIEETQETEYNDDNGEAEAPADDTETDDANDIIIEETEQTDETDDTEEQPNETEETTNETEDIAAIEPQMPMLTMRLMSANSLTLETTTIVFGDFNRSVGAGDTLSVSAYAADDNGNPTNDEVSFSIEGSAATISGSSISGNTVGTFSLIATASNGVKATLSMSVVKQPSSITLSKDSATVGVNGNTTLTYSVNEGSAGSVTWYSSDESVATVNQNGVVTGVSAGTAVITATTYNGISATCGVSVLGEPEDLKLSVSEISISENETVTVETSFTGDVYGNVYVQEISGDGEIELTSLGSGKFAIKGVLSGSVSVTFYVYNKTEDETYYARLDITVNAKAVRIEITNPRATIGVKETVDLKPVVYDGRGNVINEKVTLTTSNKSYVTVSGTSVYGKATGSSTITLKSESGLSTTLAVKTVKAPTSVTISQSTANVTVGDTLNLSVTLSAGSASAITWTSSDTSIATVDQNGVVTTLKAGSAKITASTYVSGKSASCTVNVHAIAQGISFDSDNYTLLEGMSVQTALTFMPAGALCEVTYSVADESIAVADAYGIIRAVNSGSTTITASGNGLSATAVITVNPAPAAIVLASDRVTIGKGETIDLAPKAYDISGNEVDTAFTVTSSKTNYITVNGTKLYGKTTGTSEITVTAANGLSKKISVKVVSAPSKVTLSATSLKLSQGQSAVLSYKFNSTSTTSAITWTSSNDSVVTVENGTVYAVGAGTAKVRVSTYLSNVYAECTVTVIAAPTAISFNETSYSVAEGGTIALSVSVTPAEAAQDVIYEIADLNGETIAIINGASVKGVYSGATIVTAKVYNSLTDEYISASSTLSVTPAVTSIAFRSDRSSIGLKETVDLKPVAYDARGNEIEAEIRLSSSGSAIKLVEGTTVYGNSKSSATITATAANGVKATKKYSVVTAPSSVKISASATSAAVGGTISLKAITTGTDTADVTWTSSDENVFSVNANGVATAISYGAATITAETYNGKTASVTLNALHSATGISFANASYSVLEGGSVQTAVKLSPEGSAGDITYSISYSDEYEIAKVDAATGMVYGITSGEATIVATLADHESGSSMSASAKIYVETAPASIVITGRTTIGASETVDLKPVAYDARGNEISTSFTLTSSSTSYVKPMGGTTVRGQSKGNATVTVKAANGSSVSVKVTVLKAPTAVKLSVSSANLQAGDTYQISAALGASDQAGALKYTSANTAVATVDENGLVSAISSGSAVITVSSYNNKTARFTVNVSASPTSMSFTDDSVKLVIGGTMNLSTAFEPAGSIASVTYASSDESVATVDSNGVLTAKKTGNTTITATAYSNALGENLSATLAVEVCKYPSNVEAGSDTLTIGKGETYTLNPKALDANGDEVNVSFTVSTSNKSYVTVSGTQIKGVKKGSATITITAPGGSKATIKVTVLDAPSSVSLASAVSMAVGEKYTLTPAFKANQGGSVTWQSADESIATIDANGVITALKQGSVKITVKTFNGKTAATTITVYPAPEAMSFASDTYTVSENASVATSIALTPANSFVRATYTISDEAVASVDANGKVTGIKAGSTTLTATAYNSATDTYISASCDIIVTPAAVKIAVKQTRTKLGVGETIDLMPVAYDANGNEVECTFTLKSSSNSYMTVSGTTVKALRASKPTVTITSENGISLKIQFTIVAAPTAVSVSASGNIVALNNTISLKATPTNVADAQVTWSSSNASVATVNDSGVVTAKSLGDVTITATTYNGKTGSYKLSVVPEPDSVSFDASEVKIGLGSTDTLTATLPEGTAAKIVYVSVNPYIASVNSSTGAVTGNRTGSTRIVATIRNLTTGKYYTATYTVTITPVPASIQIGTERRSIGVGEKLALNVKALDANGNETGSSFTYKSSNANYVSVDANGVLTAKKAGSATITITAYNGVKTTVSIKTVAAPTAIKLTASDTRLVAGLTTLKPTVTLTPAAATGSVSWESADETIATVDENGVISGVSYGSVKIKATTYNGKSTTITVNVYNAPDEIILSYTELSLGVGQSYTIKGSFKDDQYSTLTFSSEDESIATVDASGRISAVKQGSTNIVAESINGVKATCAVSVLPAPDSVSFTESSITIGIGQTLDAGEYIVVPSGTAASYTYTVESSKILDNLGSGSVKGKAAGSTRIKVTTHNGKTALLTVKVVKAATSYSLQLSQSVVYEGEMFEITPVFPANTMAEVSFTSSNADVIQIDESGSAKAVGVGSAIITAVSHNNVKVSTTINVYRHVSSVTLSVESATIVHYDTLKIEATIAPENVYDSSLAWESSDPDSVSVDANGVVTALNITITPVIITATSNDTGVFASAVISVTPVRVEDIELSQSELTLEKDRSAKLSVTFTPANADDQTVTWTSSAPAIATVDNEGNVTAVSDSGTAIISCVTNDGNIVKTAKVTAEKVHLVSAELETDAISIIHYDSADISYTLTPADAAIDSAVWTVSDPSVISVTQSGTLSALNVGSAKLTLTLTDSYGYSVSLTAQVTVTPVPVSGIELSETEIHLRTGRSTSVSVNIYPENAYNKNVSWTMSNSGIITLTKTEGGALLLAGSKAGETTITVTSEDGGFTDELLVKVSETLEVNVTPNFIHNTPGNDIVWTIEPLNAIGDVSYQISVTKDGASVLTSASYNTETGVSISSATIGSYQISVTITDGEGDTAEAQSDVSVEDAFILTQNNIVWEYTIVDAQGDKGAAVRLISCPAGTTSIKVPETMDGAKVVRIDTEAFMNQTSLQKVSIPESVTEIGARAFKGCTALSEITSY